ncbi:MAG: phosphatidylserine/phosphatidylglycerophosphate/cardiolipin synthase family protein [Verrucomicrobia bacterium]|nr:phosphatidylserine/phosphatidylglycerophosphate/cardiolipin synthase family protein [Verrucomicrobiota bacterium]
MTAVIKKSFDIHAPLYYTRKIPPLVKKITIIALAVLAGAAIGAFAGPIGIIIGASIGGSIPLIAIAITLLHRRLFTHRFEAVTAPAMVVQGSPPLSKYTKASVKVLTNVEDSFACKKEFMKAAKQSIELSANFAGGKEFRKVLGLIDAKMVELPHFKTHLLLSEDLLEEADKKELAALAKKFEGRFVYLITDRIFSTEPNFHSEENHVKALVVDGAFAVVGGEGISTEMVRSTSPKEDSRERPFICKLLSKSFRDMGVAVEGPIASTVRREFFRLFHKWERRMGKPHVLRFFPVAAKDVATPNGWDTDTAVLKEVRIKCVVGGPEHCGTNPIDKTLAKRILKAMREVRIASLLFNPSPRLKKALKRTEARKIGYFNGITFPLNVIQVLRSRPHYYLLSQVYEHQKTDQMYHSKVSTFDGLHTVIGSYNITEKSCESDDEIVLVVKDFRVTALVNASLDEDGREGLLMPLPGNPLARFAIKALTAPLSPLY